MQALLIILGIYLSYKFMVDFVIPVYKTSKRVQEQYRNMQQRPNPNGHATQNSYKASPVNDPAKASSKDYIEFEEVKD